MMNYYTKRRFAELIKTLGSLNKQYFSELLKSDSYGFTTDRQAQQKRLIDAITSRIRDMCFYGLVDGEEQSCS